VSFPPYESYSDSGVEWLGELPAHWVVVRLGSLFREVSEPGLDELPVLSVSIHTGVSDDEVDPDEMDRKVTRSEDRTKYKRVQPNDLVYNMMRAWQGGFGTVRTEGMVSPAYVVARPRDGVPSEFVEHVLRTPAAVEEIRRHSKGVTDFRLRLYWDEFKDIRVPLPPLAEVRGFLSFLDRETAKIDALVEEQQRLIELLKEKRQAVISHAVTKGLDPNAPMKDSGVEWLGEVPAHWEVKRLKQLITSIEQGWSPQCESWAVEGPHQWGVLKVGCVNGGVFNPEENKALPADLTPAPDLSIARGDLLISRANTRDLVGSAATADADFQNLLLCDKLYRLRVASNVYHPKLAAAFLAGPGARARIELSATGASSSMLNIAQSTILDIAVPVPPAEEQAQILRQVDDDVRALDALSADVERAIQLLQERRAALISAAVTGKIDVRGLADKPAEAEAA
jgi:type I restriction enzyme S subunit